MPCLPDAPISIRKETVDPAAHQMARQKYFPCKAECSTRQWNIVEIFKALASNQVHADPRDQDAIDRINAMLPQTVAG